MKKLKIYFSNIIIMLFLSLLIGCSNNDLSLKSNTNTNSKNLINLVKKDKLFIETSDNNVDTLMKLYSDDIRYNFIDNSDYCVTVTAFNNNEPTLILYFYEDNDYMYFSHATENNTLLETWELAWKFGLKNVIDFNYKPKYNNKPAPTKARELEYQSGKEKTTKFYLGDELIKEETITSDNTLIENIYIDNYQVYKSTNSKGYIEIFNIITNNSDMPGINLSIDDNYFIEKIFYNDNDDDDRTYYVDVYNLVTPRREYYELSSGGTTSQLSRTEILTDGNLPENQFWYEYLKNTSTKYMIGKEFKIPSISNDNSYSIFDKDSDMNLKAQELYEQYKDNELLKYRYEQGKDEAFECTNENNIMLYDYKKYDNKVVSLNFGNFDDLDSVYYINATNTEYDSINFNISTHDGFYDVDIFSDGTILIELDDKKVSELPNEYYLYVYWGLKIFNS